MALHLQSFLLIILSVAACQCIPKQYPTSEVSQHQKPLNRRSSEGWSEDTVSKPVGGTGSRVVFPKDKIVPTASPSRSKPTISLRIDKLPPRPLDCEHSKFCDDNTYPKSYLDNLLEKSGVEFQALFGSDYVEIEATSSGKGEGTLLTRIDQNEGTPLCQSRPDLIYPTKGEDAQGNTRFIINHGNFTQGIRTEKCVNLNTPCEFGDTFPNSYVATCSQRHLYRKLAALNDDNEIEWMFFPIPSCCVCTYRSRGRQGRSLYNFPMSKALKKKSSH